MSKIDQIRGVKKELVCPIVFLSLSLVCKENSVVVIDSKANRACVALSWNPKYPNLVLYNEYSLNQLIEMLLVIVGI